MDRNPSVVITGVGVISPIGIGHEAYWAALREQRSGVAVLPSTAGLDLPLSIGAAIQDFDPKQYVKPRKALKVMSREIQTGFAAAGLAMEHARLTSGQVAPERMGVVFGSEMLFCEPEEMEAVYRRCMEGGQFHFERWGRVFLSEMYPLWMLMYLPNMVACHVGIAHEARGPNNTICQGEVSSLLALIEAVLIIQRGQADVMLTGGSGSRLSLTSMLYRGINHLSRRTDTPASACRPFDATRDGGVNGEGAAVFVLEREEVAVARGANILARVAGWGIACGSPGSQTFSPRDAMVRAIEKALARSQWSPGDVGHVNANAAGSLEDDALEAQAIQAALSDVPVTAPKSYLGQSGAGCGAVEMVASLLALQHGRVPATLNYRQPDPACPVNVVCGDGQRIERTTAAILSQSCTGQAVCALLAAG